MREQELQWARDSGRPLYPIFHGIKPGPSQLAALLMRAERLGLSKEELDSLKDNANFLFQDAVLWVDTFGRCGIS